MILIVPIFSLIGFIGILFMPRKALGWCIIGSTVLAPLYNYGILETCPGDCSIRIDLLFIIPLFFFMILIWVVKK